MVPRILSQSMMVCSLCAMVGTVQWRNLSLMASWIRVSVLGSTLAVASSRTRILFCLSTALARHTGCL